MYTWMCGVYGMYTWLKMQGRRTLQLMEHRANWTICHVKGKVITVILSLALIDNMQVAACHFHGYVITFLALRLQTCHAIHISLTEDQDHKPWMTTTLSESALRNIYFLYTECLSQEGNICHGTYAVTCMLSITMQYNESMRNIWWCHHLMSLTHLELVATDTDYHISMISPWLSWLSWMYENPVHIVRGQHTYCNYTSCGHHTYQILNTIYNHVPLRLSFLLSTNWQTHLPLTRSA